VASREDNQGVLILSTFAGAALELTDAPAHKPPTIVPAIGAAAIHRAF